jgi:hypothetical protein
METISRLKTDTFNSKAFKELSPVMKEAISDIYKLIEQSQEDILNSFENSVNKIAEFHNINKKSIEEYFDRELKEQLGE